jgi:amino acid adenylation domain-containing protein
MQQGMLFHALAAPAAGIDVQQLVVELHEDIDESALTNAIKRLVNHHDVLRTRLTQDANGVYRQYVDAQAQVEIDIQDWSAMSAEAQRQRREEYLAADRSRGFRADSESFLRSAIIRCSERHSTFVFTSWHGIFDGRAGLRLQQDLFALYAAERNGTPLTLPKSAAFVEFVEWITSRDTSASREFWRTLLAGYQPGSLNGGDSSTLPRPDEYRQLRQTISEGTCERLHRLVAEKGISLNVVLQAAWGVCLSRRVGTNDVVIGTTRACRMSALDGRAKDIVGVLINTVPVRIQADNAMTGVELFRAIRQQHVEVRPHEHTPLVDIQAAAGFRADRRLFDSLFLFEHDQIGHLLERGGAEWRNRTYELVEATGYPLTAYGYGGQHPILKLLYQQSSISDAVAHDLLMQWHGLVEALAQSPERTIGEITPRTQTTHSVSGLLERLKQLDIRIWAENGRLRVSAPSGAMTPALQQLLGQRKAGLLAALNAVHESPPIPLAAIGGAYPASFSQERMWFLQQLAPDSPAYIVARAVKVVGVMDPEVVAASWQEAVRRHELLASRFRLEDATLMVEGGGEPPAFDLIDLRGCLREERETVAWRVSRERGIKLFDLERGPLARLTMMWFGDEQVLVVSAHHAVSDFWSINLLLRDLAATYSARVAGRPGAALPAPSLRYSDYARWHRPWMSGAQWDREWGYWRKQLSGIKPLNLPTDKPRPSGPTLAGDVAIRPLPGKFQTQLTSFSQNHAVTPYVTLFAAFAALLSRYSGQQQFAIGVPVAGRHHTGTEDIVGPFINTLVIRLDATGDPTMRELLGRVRESILDAQAHQDAPIERLVSGLVHDRQSGHPPLVQVMLNGISGPRHFDFAGLDTHRLLIGWQTSLLDLTVYVDLEEMHSLLAEFSTDLFERSTVERILTHYQTAIDSFLEDPDVRLSRLQIFDAGERGQVVTTWNDTARTWPTTDLAIDLFEQQAARAPDRVAVSLTDGSSVTYRDLEERATVVAHALAARGVGKGTLVAIGTTRSAWMVAALLGVWKAGAAYVPVDSGYPRARVATMLQDSGARVLLTERTLRGLWPDSVPDVIELDAMEPKGAPFASVNTAPTDVAYVIYTSGSTGKPKGVEISHGALINFLHSMTESPGFSSADCLLAVTTLSFDIAGLELFLPLINGGRIELASPEEAIDGARLLDRLRRSPVTVLQATPATWRLLLGAGMKRQRGLRALCGGEAVPRDLANDLLDRCDEVWNMYGPTETTVWSTIDRVRRENTVPIGGPIANTRVFVLDASHQPCAIGVPGELFIGGAGLARGYFGLPELTGERFIPDPLSGDGSRLYRTGDVARWRADGRLECLGRVDQQVKIRGFRIELGEIEAVLCQHPSVAQAAVGVYEPAPGDKRLVAYIVGHTTSTIDDTGLRAHVKEYLAGFMVPASFVTLRSLPLTDNGKIDRRALPAPTPVAPGGETVQPANEIERAIARLFADVLNLASVPLDGNFFDLGGHSLLFAQVQSQLAQRLGYQVSMLELFQSPTVRSLAARYSSRAGSVATGTEARQRISRQLLALDQQRSKRALTRGAR